MDEILKYKISTENLHTLKEDGVYLNLDKSLKDGLFNDLSIIVSFFSDYKDIGYYEEFDGLLLQKDIITNFIYTFDESNDYEIIIKNTSDEFKKFTDLSTYTVDFGDGTVLPFTDTVTHQYPFTNSNYTIKVTQKNPWGVIDIKKNISLPANNYTINNIDGTVIFNNNNGMWGEIPNSYDFMSFENIDYNDTNVILKGKTTSRLSELKQYGTDMYPINKPIFKDGELYGVINDINNNFIHYTIKGIDYFDFDNKTEFIINKNNFINEFTDTLLTKNDLLIGVTMSPEIESEVFIERGKNSGVESLQRLGEVDSMGDLVNYGYKFFKINKII